MAFKTLVIILFLINVLNTNIKLNLVMHLDNKISLNTCEPTGKTHTMHGPQFSTNEGM